MNLKFDRQDLIQLGLTIITFILTTLLPIISYIQFRLTGLEYDVVFISVILVGITLTCLRYYMYRFHKSSIQTKIIRLINSLLFIIFLTIIAQIGIINISIENGYFYLDLSGVFIVLISVWSLFILKNAYDLIDYKANLNHYSQTQRKKKLRVLTSLIECSNCNYTCQRIWKKCPICNTPLTKTR